MNRMKTVFVFGACLLSAVGLAGQTHARRGEGGRDAEPPTESSIDQGSVSSISRVASGPQVTSQGILPRLVKFSGALRDITGKALSGPVAITFSLYDQEAGGTPLWFETQTVQADEQGRYTALLGAMHDGGLPMELFVSGEARWLGVQAGQDAEQQPRVLLVSVAYALKAGDADTLGGKPASAYVLGDAPGSAISTGNPATATPAVRKGALLAPTIDAA